MSAIAQPGSGGMRSSAVGAAPAGGARAAPRRVVARAAAGVGAAARRARQHRDLARLAAPRRRAHARAGGTARAVLDPAAERGPPRAARPRPRAVVALVLVVAHAPAADAPPGARAARRAALHRLGAADAAPELVAHALPLVGGARAVARAVARAPRRRHRARRARPAVEAVARARVATRRGRCSWRVHAHRALDERRRQGGALLHGDGRREAPATARRGPWCSCRGWRVEVRRHILWGRSRAPSHGC